jgi:glycosyltransferase involved in cell wall biosynthesis
MKPGVTACLICYNEEYWIQRTLPAIVTHADAVVIVDGGPFGPSNDRTEEIVLENLSPWVTYIRGKFGNERSEGNWDQVQRNVYLEHVRTSHMLLIDADEAYLPEDWEKFRQYAEQGVEAITYPYVHFYVDCGHRLQGGIWDAPCHHFTRFQIGYRYTDLTTILRKADGQPVVDGAIHDPTITLFHYNRVSPPEVYKAKQAKFWRRWDGGGLGDEAYWQRWNTWQDDRTLDNPEVVAWEGHHPLEGVI